MGRGGAGLGGGLYSAIPALRRRARTEVQLALPFSKILWCLRRERGESTFRWHQHAVIAGLPPSAGERNCLALMSQWERLGGGIARVSVYNSSLDRLDYILKGSGLTESTATRWAGDYHELSKSGGSCDVTLSKSVCRYLGNRSRSGWRGIGGHETRGTDTASSTVRSGVSKAPPSERVTGPAITVQTPLDS
jgi:hypothetical protein